MPAYRRVPRPQAARAKFREKTFAAPIAGWVTATSLIASTPGAARVLDNFFPMQASIRQRGGCQPWAEIGTAIDSFITYVGSVRRRMFAATETAIYDVSSISDGEITPAVTGRRAGYYSHINFSTEGGEFVEAANGIDPLLIFDGSTWYEVTGTSTPYAVTFTGSSTMTTSRISHVAAYQNRIFFVRTGSMELWYLPVNSLAGAAQRLSLAGVFKRGGSIYSVSTWSMDAGDGLDDKLVVMTTAGEAAIYQGTNPSDVATWGLVGRYDISPLMGPNGNMQAGGDLLVLTEAGFVAVSGAVNKDPAALALSAVSRNIEPDWRAAVISNRARPWEVAKWTRQNMAVVSIPSVTAEDQTLITFVVNLQTGAWARYTGWDARCLCVHDDWLYFGTADGKVMQAEVGPDDDGASYTCTAVLAWDHFGAIGSRKIVSQARATFLSVTAIDPQISVSADYVIELPDPPAAPDVDPLPGFWDVGLWDEAVWDDPAQVETVNPGWVSIGASGRAFAPQLQMAGNGQRAEFVEVTFTYQENEVVS